MRSFVSETGGATAIEYTLIAMLIALVIIGALTSMGTQLNTMIAQVAPSLL